MERSRHQRNRGERHRCARAQTPRRASRSCSSARRHRSGRRGSGKGTGTSERRRGASSTSASTAVKLSCSERSRTEAGLTTQEHARGEGQRVERIGGSLHRATQEDDREHQRRADRRRLVAGEDDVAPDQRQRPRAPRGDARRAGARTTGTARRNAREQRRRDQRERRDVEPADAQDVGEAAPGEAVLPLGTEPGAQPRRERAYQRRVVRADGAGRGSRWPKRSRCSATHRSPRLGARRAERASRAGRVPRKPARGRAPRPHVGTGPTSRARGPARSSARSCTRWPASGRTSGVRSTRAGSGPGPARRRRSPTSSTPRPPRAIDLHRREPPFEPHRRAAVGSGLALLGSATPRTEPASTAETRSARCAPGRLRGHEGDGRQQSSQASRDRRRRAGQLRKRAAGAQREDREDERTDPRSFQLQSRIVRAHLSRHLEPTPRPRRIQFRRTRGARDKKVEER